MKYKNMDRLMVFTNRHSDRLGVRMRYSTLTDYFSALHTFQKANKIDWSVRQGDFFPYASDNISYWAGYYTSRPDLKQLSRNASAVLRMSETAQVIADAFGLSLLSSPANLTYLRKASALVQHHDAITGTERRVTYRDYRRRLEDGIQFAQTVAESAMGRLTGLPSLSTNPAKLFELLEHHGRATVVLFNTLEQTNIQVIKLKVPKILWKRHIQVTSSGSTVAHQLSEGLSYGQKDPDLFVRCEVPALGYQIILIETSEPIQPSRKEVMRPLREEDQVTLENEFIQAHFSRVLHSTTVALRSPPDVSHIDVHSFESKLSQLRFILNNPIIQLLLF